MPLESVEQQHIVQLARSIGGRVWVLGTRRPKGDRPSTMQSPGLPDLYLVVPVPVRDAAGQRVGVRWVALWWETKRQRGSVVRPEQEEFRGYSVRASVEHGIGPFDAFCAWLVTKGVVAITGFSADRVAGVQRYLGGGVHG